MAKSVSEHHVRLVAETAQYETQMKSAAFASRALQVEQGKAAAAAQTGSKAASRFGVVAQQAGYQVQDFAVQVAAGQSAMVALAQQGSQMLGVFGTTGAIAGAVLTVGILAYRLFDTAENAKTAAGDVDKLSASFEQLAKAKKEAYLSKADEINKERSAQNDLLVISKKTADNELRKAKAYEMMQRAGRMQRLESVGIFPDQESETKATIEFINTGNFNAEKFGGKSYTARALGEFALSEMEASQTALDQLNIDKIAAQSALEKSQENQAERVNDELKLNAERIGKELKLEDEKAKKLVELDKWRADKARARMDLLAGDMFREIYGGAGEYEKAILGLQSRIPQSLQVNTGASALGGVAGNNSIATETRDIQRQILEGIRALVLMERMAN